jgi:hypothetical protein
MNYVLKLCEKAVGERMLVACLYNKLPCGHTGSSTCKQCGIQSLNYEEWMLCALTEEVCEKLFGPIRPFGEPDYVLPPMTEEQKQKGLKLKENMRPYQGKALVVGGREYPIYDANKDFFPCGNAPEIELTDEEVVAWREEFQGRTAEDSFATTSYWTPFNDELFLK